MSEVTSLGDAAPGQVFYAFFNTRDNTGAGSALSSGSVRAYKNGGTTESTAGLTLATDFDGLTGLNLITIDTSADGTFYAAGADFAVMWAGTVNGIASTGNAAAGFSLSNRSVRDSSGVTTLLTRLSAARAGYLDNLSAGAVALEASLQALITTIGASAAGVATAVWGAASRTLSAFGFTVTAGTVSDKTGYALTAAYDAAKTAAQAGDAMALTSGERASTGTAVWATTTRVLTAGTNIALAKGTGVTGFNDLSAAQVNAEADTAISDAALASAANLAIVAGYLDTEIAAIKAKTDNLPAAPAATGDIPSAATIASAAAAQVTSDHGSGSYVRNTEPDNTGIGDAATAAASAASSGSTLTGRLTSTRAGLLDNLDAAVSSRLASGSYTAPPSAATVASAVRTELAVELARLDAAVTTRAATGAAMALTSGERATLAAAILTLTDGVETNWTLQQVMRIVLAVLGGKSNGFTADGATAGHFRNPGDTTNRVTVLADEFGNRSTVTLDAA